MNEKKANGWGIAGIFGIAAYGAIFGVGPLAEDHTPQTLAQDPLLNFYTETCVAKLSGQSALQQFKQGASATDAFTMQIAPLSMQACIQEEQTAFYEDEKSHDKTRGVGLLALAVVLGALGGMLMRDNNRIDKARAEALEASKHTGGSAYIPPYPKI